MTREEIEELKGLAASMGLYDDKNPCKRAVILGKAIKALEQEPVLDKIWAEIDSAEMPKNRMSFFRDGINCALRIIDKYRAEKGDKDWDEHFCPHCGQALNWEIPEEGDS